MGNSLCSNKRALYSMNNPQLLTDLPTRRFYQKSLKFSRKSFKFDQRSPVHYKQSETSYRPASQPIQSRKKNSTERYVLSNEPWILSEGSYILSKSPTLHLYLNKKALFHERGPILYQKAKSPTIHQQPTIFQTRT